MVVINHIENGDEREKQITYIQKHVSKRHVGKLGRFQRFICNRQKVYEAISFQVNN